MRNGAVMIDSNHRCSSPCSAIFTNSCFIEFEEKARKATKEGFARDSPFSFFLLFSRRYFYRQSERVNGFNSEYGSSVFAVTWCIKKKQRQYTIWIKSL